MLGDSVQGPFPLLRVETIDDRTQDGVGLGQARSSLVLESGLMSDEIVPVPDQIRLLHTRREMGRRRPDQREGPLLLIVCQGDQRSNRSDGWGHVVEPQIDTDGHGVIDELPGVLRAAFVKADLGSEAEQMSLEPAVTGSGEQIEPALDMPAGGNEAALSLGDPSQYLVTERLPPRMFFAAKIPEGRLGVVAGASDHRESSAAPKQRSPGRGRRHVDRRCR